MEILFVGDIQGCAEELAQLLDRAGFIPGRHRCIPLGDTVNRGPDAAGVLRLLEEAGAEPLQGNHELGLLKIGATEDPPAWALREGSAWQQLHQAGVWEEALRRFSTWPLVRRGAGWIAVHAGLHPQLPPEQAGAVFTTTVRWCDSLGRLPQGVHGDQVQPPPGFAPWHSYYQGPDTVLFGHWARQGLLRLPHLWGLDTGCVYGRELTGLWWPEQRLVSVPARRVYQAVRNTREDAG